MNDINEIKNLIMNNDGYIFENDINEYNMDESFLKSMIDLEIIEKVEENIYISRDVFPDSYFILQNMYPKIVFSNITALYFYGIGTVMNYEHYNLNIPYNYQKDNLKSHFLNELDDEIYQLGLTKIKTPFGNYVNTYDLERVICDLLVNHDFLDIDQYAYCLKDYLKRKDKDLNKLYIYSKKLKISDDKMDVILVLNELI
ncbi:MAG: hypothetical protein R3Y21_03880 [Mycoplasmatota bacterium]